MLNPSLQDKTGIILVNSDGTFNSIYPLGDKPGAAPVVFDKIISSTTSVNDRFTGMTAGMRVGLLDGIYLGFKESSIPDNVAIEAINHGAVTISGGDDAWRAVIYLDGTGKELNGLRIGKPDNINSNALQLLGSGHIIKNCGLFDGGAHKHKIPLMVGGSGHLLEDCWAWGTGRYTIQSFQADNCIFRRVLARWDDTVGNEAGEPNAAFVCYNSNDMLYENCISLDYGTPETAMLHGGDFFQANNVTVSAPNSNNRFYGMFIVNHALNTTNRHAFRNDGTQNGGQSNLNNIIDDLYVRDNGNGLVVSTPFTTIEMRKGTFINAIAPTGSYVPTGPAQTDFQWINGVLTSNLLWPWPNEARIRADLSGSDSRRSTNPADTAWVNTANTGYAAWTAGSKSLKDYILGL